jgi:hypothetical protein
LAGARRRSGFDSGALTTGTRLSYEARSGGARAAAAADGVDGNAVAGGGATRAGAASAAATVTVAAVSPGRRSAAVANGHSGCVCPGSKR